MRVRAATCLLLALAASGCLGADHVFPDDSARVVALHVNAYAHVGQDGVVEITGRDAQNVTRAFRGAVRLSLDEQHDPPEPPTYTHVLTRDLDLAPLDFSNPGESPVHVETLPRASFPEAGTYRVTLSARLGDRALPDASALFYAEP
jgi:hypothetical protein